MSTDDLPIWLLDVDGPINANKAGWSAAPFQATVTAQRDFKLRWSPALINRIRAIHAHGQAEIWWCTTWCPWAHLLENLWALPRLPRALPDEVCRAGGVLCWSAKADAARAVITSGRRLIWTDDEVTPTEGPLFDELTAGGRALLIAPSPSRGLRPEHLDAIEAFCGPGTGQPIPAGDLAARELRLWVPAAPDPQDQDEDEDPDDYRDRVAHGFTRHDNWQDPAVVCRNGCGLPYADVVAGKIRRCVRLPVPAVAEVPAGRRT